MTVQVAASANNHPTRSRCRVAHAWLRADIYAALEIEAKVRSVHVDQLLGAIAEVVVDRDLFDAFFGE